MTPTAPESFLGYYRRLFMRAGRDARTHIARNGIIVGLLIAVVTGFAQSRLDDEADFGSAALAACIAAGSLSLLFFLWHLLRAPVALSNDDRANVASRLLEATSPKDDAIAARDSEIARLRSEVQGYKTTLDHEAPKLALMEQLRKLDAIGGLALAAALGRSDEDVIERTKEDAEAARAWEFETRQIIRNAVPQYERDFDKGARLPPSYMLKLGAKPPSIQQLRQWKFARRARLSEIIKQL
jgi:hypothetical protein